MLYKEVLSNGVRVVIQEMPGVPSVSVGIWAETGSSHETPELNGVSHFLEHMLFKGTTNRNAKEIANALESVGGQMNAFTTKEYTCFYAKTLKEHLSLSMDVLSDMYLNSTIPQEEFVKEKGVVLEEVRMYEDSPDDVVTDQYAAAIYGDHPYGWPIIGTVETVSALTRDQMYAYYKEHYAPEHTVVSIAGDVDKEAAMEIVMKYLGKFQGAKKPIILPEISMKAGSCYQYKDIEQMHLCLGVPGLAAADERTYTLSVLSAILSGGTCSRLFQAAREERGLTYTIYSYHAGYIHGGSFLIYTSTNPQNLDEMIAVILETLRDVSVEGVTEEELSLAKEQLRCGMLMSTENSANVMSKLGKGEIVLGEVLPISALIEKVMAVTKEDVQNLAKDLFADRKFMLSLVGPEERQYDLAAMFDALK